MCLVTNVLDTLFGPNASDVIFQLPSPITKVFLVLSLPSISTNSSFKYVIISSLDSSSSNFIRLLSNVTYFPIPLFIILDPCSSITSTIDTLQFSKSLFFTFTPGISVDFWSFSYISFASNAKSVLILNIFTLHVLIKYYL